MSEASLYCDYLGDAAGDVGLLPAFGSPGFLVPEHFALFLLLRFSSPRVSFCVIFCSGLLRCGSDNDSHLGGILVEALCRLCVVGPVECPLQLFFDFQSGELPSAKPGSSTVCLSLLAFGATPLFFEGDTDIVWSSSTFLSR